MIRSIVIILLIANGYVPCSAQSSSDCTIDMTTPISYTTRLSGSYGEPRTRHFHAGIDYKQKRGVPYDTIYSVAEGYVSRISVQPGGYGQALYIDHPCDKTSVYAHLHNYAPNIEAYIDSVMYAQQNFAVNFSPLVHGDTIRVEQGSYIGIMGNTGRSSGAHLHFEIRETSSDTPINPALLGFKPNDDIAPEIVGLFVYELTPDNEEISRKYYPAQKTSSGFYALPKEVVVGAHKIGLGIRTYDRMNGASNHNGIYSLDMYVDGEAQFGFTLDSIPFAEAKYIHAHMDYREKKAKRYVTQCFLSDINELDFYRTNETKGFINPYTYRSTDVNVVVADIEGNKSIIQLSLRRDDTRNYGLENMDSTQVRLTPFKTASLENEGTSVTFFDSTFSQPIRIRLGEYHNDLIDLRQEVDIPVFRRYKVTHKYVRDTSIYKKLYVLTSTNDKGEKVRHKIKWLNDDTFLTYLSHLEKFEVGIDKVPPVVTILQKPGLSSSRLSFTVKDNLIPEHPSEALDIEVLLDGRWVLFNYDEKTNKIWFDMPIARDNQTHDVDIKVTDASDIITVRSLEFKY